MTVVPLGLSLERCVLVVARSQLGKGETSANNRGEYIIQIRRGIDDASPWCAAGGSYVYEEAALMTGAPLPKPLRRSHVAKVLIRRVAQAGQELKVPEPGGAICFHRGDPNGWQGHFAFMEEYEPKTDTLITIEGNVGPFPSVWQRRKYERGAYRNHLYMMATTRR